MSEYFTRFPSPIGELLLTSDGDALTGWIEGITGTSVPDPEAGTQTVRTIGTSTIWVAYFLQSKRVKATFIVP